MQTHESTNKAWDDFKTGSHLIQAEVVSPSQEPNSLNPSKSYLGLTLRVQVPDNHIYIYIYLSNTLPNMKLDYYYP